MEMTQGANVFLSEQLCENTEHPFSSSEYIKSSDEP